RPDPGVRGGAGDLRRGGAADRQCPPEPGHHHRGADPPAGHEEEGQEEGQEVTPPVPPQKKPRRGGYHEPVSPKGHPPHPSRTRHALILIALAIIGTYLAWRKEIPSQSHYELHAVFQNAVNIRKDSPVRIAGVNVGKVTGVKSVCADGDTDNCESNASEVTF